MPYLVRDSFYSSEIGRKLEAGETVDLTDEEAKAHKGQLRRTTQRSAKKRRS